MVSEPSAEGEFCVPRMMIELARLVIILIQGEQLPSTICDESERLKDILFFFSASKVWKA